MCFRKFSRVWRSHSYSAKKIIKSQKNFYLFASHSTASLWRSPFSKPQFTHLVDDFIPSGRDRGGILLHIFLGGGGGYRKSPNPSESPSASFHLLLPLPKLVVFVFLYGISRESGMKYRRRQKKPSFFSFWRFLEEEV